MTQVSRRYLIALAVLVLFAAVWYAALRPHSSSSSGSPASAAKSPQGPGSPTGVYHGSAAGVEGLTRAISKAHEAVAQSERNANQLQQKSNQASSSSGAGSSSGTAPASGAAQSTAPAAHPGASTHSRTSTHAPASPRHKSPHSSLSPLKTPVHQQLVEHAIKHGKIAVVLFWSPRGGDDLAVRRQLQILEAAHHQAGRAASHSAAVRHLLKASGLELQKPITVLDARANEVTWFGSFTRAVQIYQTPTILIVNRQSKVKSLTGLTDAYSIEQAIDEARNS